MWTLQHLTMYYLLLSSSRNHFVNPLSFKVVPRLTGLLKLRRLKLAIQHQVDFSKSARNFLNSEYRQGSKPGVVGVERCLRQASVLKETCHRTVGRRYRPTIAVRKTEDMYKGPPLSQTRCLGFLSSTAILPQLPAFS